MTKPLKGSTPDVDGQAVSIEDFFPSLKALQDEIETANRAVLTAVQSVARLGDPAVAALFGIDAGALAVLRTSRASSFHQSIRSGIPLFSLRFTTADVLSDLRHDMGASAVMQSILKSIPVEDIPRGA